jgi:nucleotide-binding universal stress UspA family protein
MLKLDQGTVLVPIDFSDESLQAVEKARAMVAGGGTLHVVTVLVGDGDPAISEALSNHAHREAQVRHELLRQVGGEVTHHVRFGDPGAEISRLAGELDVNVIVIPSHGKDASSLPLGSTAERVARLAPCPVFLVRKA